MKTNISTSHAYKTGKAQSQKITTLANSPDTYMPHYPLCLKHTHNINHLLIFSKIPTEHHAISGWKNLWQAAKVT